jgi:hypothetical protein
MAKGASSMGIDPTSFKKNEKKKIKITHTVDISKHHDTDVCFVKDGETICHHWGHQNYQKTAEGDSHKAWLDVTPDAGSALNFFAWLRSLFRGRFHGSTGQLTVTLQDGTTELVRQENVTVE